jgi:UDP-N-acetylglucosamine enolpyruvyl transferase
MEKLVIQGGVPLSGTIVPAGNKNAALPLLAASLLTAEEVVVDNVPRIRDVEAMLELLADLGVKVSRRGDNCWLASAAPYFPRPAATSSAGAGSIRTSTPSAPSARPSSTTATSASAPPPAASRRRTSSWTSRQ